MKKLITEDVYFENLVFKLFLNTFFMCVEKLSSSNSLPK